MVKQSAIEIGSVTLSAKPKLDNELPLLDCDGSPYFVADYPILTSKLERKFIEPSIIPELITHANVSEYMNSKSTVKVINSVLHIYIATAAKAGVITSSDGGQTFSEFTEFTDLINKPNYSANTIKVSDDGQTMLMCPSNSLITFTSKNAGITWTETTHTGAGLTRIYDYDVAPSGLKMFCVTAPQSSRVFIHTTNGGDTWAQKAVSGVHYANYFEYLNDVYIVFADTSDNEIGKLWATLDFKTVAYTATSLTQTVSNNKGAALARAGGFGGTSTDNSRYYISTNNAGTWTLLPYRADVFGKNHQLNTIIDFLLTASNDLYVANSDGVFLLKDGATNWSRVFKPNSVAEQITGQARLAEINGDVFIIIATAFYKTDSVLEDYLFFTPDLSDSPLNSVCKLVGDKQP